MSVLRPDRTSCATCGQTAGIFTCRGCSENFCLRHTNEHREGLEKQMKHIIQSHQQLKQNITGPTNDQSCQSLLQQIERWEQQSLAKIRQVANDTRDQVLGIVRQRTDDLKDQLSKLSQQLDKAHKDGNYFEDDIRNWLEKLQKCQHLFQEQQSTQLYFERSSVPFISKISLHDITNDALPQPSSEGLYQRKLTKYTDDYSNSPESGEYSRGERSLRFQIEQYSRTSSILFGIISKNSLDNDSPHENPTFYGWGSKNLVYRGGDIQANYDGYKTDIQTDDILMLSIDCDRETISLKNERTQRTYVLQIDLSKCPFPWRPNVRFISN
ncbi:unnamed protein product [Adineta ricciae]|uniref:B box-type domain-containing protein n=1 Tax=Adineta ricciae TaxID=249248 RepID=A0A814UXE0_ADIRI|nr:unnamed protein product [Adineta ricciae]